MKPLYFPFTTISEPVLGALLTCFKQVALYHPSRNHVPESLRNWEAGGRLQIRLPIEDDNDPLPDLLKAYRAWAELHEGERPDFEKFRPPLTAYTEATSTSRIRSDIRNAAEGTGNAPSRDDKERSILLRARLFLTVAQEHDQLRQSLREDLDRIGSMEKELFRNLLDDREAPFPTGPPNRTAEEAEADRHMSGTRLRAWAHLHLHHRKKADAETPHDLLITSDRFVLDRLLEQADEADMLCSVSGIPFGPVADPSGDVFFNEQRCEKLRNLAAGSDRPAGWDDVFPETGKRAGAGRLTIYRIKGDAIADVLSGSGNRPELSRMHRDAAETACTLAGSITRNNP